MSTQPKLIMYLWGQITAVVFWCPSSVAHNLKGLQLKLQKDIIHISLICVYTHYFCQYICGHEVRLTVADPLWGPRVLTSLPNISKPSVGKVPRGRAGLSPTRWQSTDRDTLTWLTDKWICQSVKERRRISGRLNVVFIFCPHSKYSTDTSQSLVQKHYWPNLRKCCYLLFLREAFALFYL